MNSLFSHTSTAHTTHPEYEEFREKWIMMKDTFEGEDKVKRRSTLYLPATTSMAEDGLEVGQPGNNSYKSYIMRARFPEHVQDAVDRSIGDMHRKSPTLEIPSELEYIRQVVSRDGASIKGLLIQINEHQIRDGRYGLLIDASEDNRTYIASYEALDIINWAETRVDGRRVLSLVVLDESRYMIPNQSLSWTWVQSFRFLRLAPDASGEISTNSVYETAEGDNSGTLPEEWIIPSIQGKALNFIPFCVINATNLLIQPRKPPLLPLARLALSQYRGDADYRQQLHGQTQETFVTIGRIKNEDPVGEKTLRVGAGALVSMEKDGDAKMVGPTSKGITEARIALQDDEKKAQSLSGRLIANRLGNPESGEAVRQRASNASTSLHVVAATAEAGLNKILGWMAEWMGLSGLAAVSVNTDFVENAFDPAQLLSMMKAKTLGAPISDETIHTWLQDQDLTSIEFAEELVQIMKEEEAKANLPNLEPRVIPDDLQ